jgi:hypothetical protein
MAFLLFSGSQAEKEADAAGPFAVLCRKRGLRPDSKSRPIRLLATCAVRQSTQNQNDKPHLDRLTTSQNSKLLGITLTPHFLSAGAEQK